MHCEYNIRLVFICLQNVHVDAFWRNYIIFGFRLLCTKHAAVVATPGLHSVGSIFNFPLPLTAVFLWFPQAK